MKVTLGGGAREFSAAYAEMPLEITGIKEFAVVNHPDGATVYRLGFPTLRDAEDAARALGLMDPLGARFIILRMQYGGILAGGMLYTTVSVTRR